MRKQSDMTAHAVLMEAKAAIAARNRAKVSVILSQQAGVHKSTILTKKEAIKAIAKQRRIMTEYYTGLTKALIPEVFGIQVRKAR